MKLMWNSITQIPKTEEGYYNRQAIDEHFTVIGAILNDIMRDQNDVITYLNAIDNGVLPLQIMPIEEILTQLQIIASHLPQDVHLPFAPEVANWLQISKFITINAYHGTESTFTIFTLPLITYPTYIINIIPVPTHDHEDIFAVTKISHTKVAVNVESHTYLALD
ncbi:hypothetical protein EAI_04402 [Harpegnathos saltator]|uniref:Uncharacterized protein n=1 Tax=Harpegnathos saltator TaxID=610380 RepID=E2BMS8_HARSA|nr:hypothetical protein EAI_04402 [Harpegnathos saltator]